MYKSIAIDGPSGAGKSTISKKLAKCIGFEYLDTGAMYRAYTYYYLKNNLNIDDENIVIKYLDDIKLSIVDGNFFIGDENVDKEIRSKEVTLNVSLVSSYASVREKLVKEQREISKKSNIVLDGRDIGSHVLPNASIKFYLDATAEERARRRYLQLNDDSLSFEDILEDIIRRDTFDSTREISPLVKAYDAILIDSTNLEIEEVIELMKKYLGEYDVI